MRGKSLAFITGKTHMDISRKMADEILNFYPVKIHDQSSLPNILASVTHHNRCVNAVQAAFKVTAH